MSSKPNRDNTALWDNNRRVIRSRNGGWVIGQGVFCHGYDMMEQLVGHCSYMQVIVLNATGRMITRELADWIEAGHICLSWPDPRIWCNHIGALGGAARTSVVAATMAGVLAADSRIYGGRTLLGGMQFIQAACREFRSGKSVKAIVADECRKYGGNPHIMGFARPLAKGDERIVAMERVTETLGFEVGEHLQLAYAIDALLMAEFDEGMNINGYVAAFMSDQGFSPDELYNMTAGLVSSGVTACYVDTAGRPAGSFLPLTCDDIVYEGHAQRPVPDRE